MIKHPNFKVYAVGGSVRDEILGLEPQDRDYVVVGASPQDLLDLGFEQVGQGFPVFLHPETKEEYALARKEKKVSAGYTGFEFDTSKSVTLEEDLYRRDFSMNSIAKDEDGNLIDPYGGIDDIKNKIIRHTSEAFAEDPLRVIRLARFYNRYQDFSFDPSTLILATKIVKSGALGELPTERFLAELTKVFSEDKPVHRFFTCLFYCSVLDDDCSALDDVQFFKNLFGPDIDVKDLDTLIKVGNACMTLDKDLRVQFFTGIMAPKITNKLVCSTSRALSLNNNLHSVWALHKNFNEMTLFKVLSNARAFDAMNHQGNDLCIALALMKMCNIETEVSSYEVRMCIGLCRAVNVQEFIDLGLEGKALGVAISLARTNVIKSILKR